MVLCYKTPSEKNAAPRLRIFASLSDESHTRFSLDKTLLLWLDLADRRPAAADAKMRTPAFQSNPDAMDMGNTANAAAIGGIRLAKNPTRRPTMTTVGNSTNRNNCCA